MAPESTVAVVWPGIAATRAGRLLGRWCAVEKGLGRAFTLGRLLALLTAPLSLALYFWRLAPRVCRRYRLTDRRVVVLEGISAAEGPCAALDAFDAIDVDVLPGQAWLRAGDLVFKREGRELLRLPGVPHPEVFRGLCLRTRDSLLAVRRVLEGQAV